MVKSNVTMAVLYKYMFYARFIKINTYIIQRFADLIIYTHMYIYIYSVFKLYT